MNESAQLTSKSIHPMSTASVEVRAPAEQTEGTRSQVLRWLKSVGDRVEENEPLIEIETDKVTVEVAAPSTGILQEIVKAEQEEIAPGELLGQIAPLGASVAAASSGSVAVMTAEPSLAGGIPSPGPAIRPESSEAPPTSAGSTVVPADFSAGAQAASARLSPAVRRLLAEHALQPGSIRGTGLGGRITVEDVMLAVAQRGGGRAEAARAHHDPAPGHVASGAPSPATPVGSATDGRSHYVPHSPVRKRIAEHMVRSLLHTAPHVTTVFEADLSAVLEHRSRHRDEFAKQGVALTLTAYFLTAAAEAIRAVPEANSRWTESALEVFDSIHIGVATAVGDDELVVPVLRDVDTRDLFGIAAGLDELVTRAREGRLSPADVRGGTFTISNHGVSGSLLATPIIINQPQSAILGIGKLEKRPVVLEENGEERVVIRPRCYVTLTIDHRVMDGHRANRFLQTFVARLTNWAE